VTYCAGWAYETSIFLIADTAATKTSRPNAPYSSFGQLHDIVRGAHVEESLLKLVTVGPGAAVAFAGDVQLAVEIARHLRENFHPSANPEVLLASLSTSLGPFDPARPVELLLATAPAGERPRLARWDTIDSTAKSDLDFCQIGSLTSYHGALTEHWLAVLAARNLSAENLLSSLTAVVQSYGIHDNLIDQNVGGLIFGLRLSDGAVEWQSDTTYVVYDPSLRNVNFISALVRGDALVISSSFNDDVRIFLDSVSPSTADDWLQRWEKSVKDQLNSDKFRYWVFLGTERRAITVVRRESLGTPNQYVTLTSQGGGKFDLGISPKLMKVLCTQPTDRQDGSIPFRLNFLND
jgi:hypothetical protein